MLDTNKLYPYLFSVVAHMQKHKLYIATAWVKRDLTSQILLQRKISAKKFRDGYGVAILEYFISVINEQKPLGDCPIMSKFVKYLLKKDITPREVFDICMDFRSALRIYLFTKNVVVENPLGFTNEIALIMDANLSGVLEIFTEFYKSSKEKLGELESQKDILLEEKEQVEEKSSIDKGTGLINYITFVKTINETIKESLKSPKRIFLSIIDIPNLRAVNLEQGREIGDLLVSNLAQELKEFTQDYITLGRLEGGRFGMLVQCKTEQEAYDWCIDLYKSISDKDEKLIFCITEIDSTAEVSKLLLRAYDLIDEANTNENIIINTDFEKIMPFKELSEQSEFINEFEKLKTIESVLHYKELTLNNIAKIKDITTSGIQITASIKQIKVAQIGKFIYFNLEKLGNVKASIKTVDEDYGRLTLESFRFDIHSPLDRKLYRVEASDDFRGYIQDNNRDYGIQVLNMNNQYIAVVIDRKRNFDIETTFNLHIRMIIDEIAHNFETITTIKRIEKVVGGYKFVLLCNLDTQNEEILQEYLASYQRNIIKDFQV